MISIKLKKNILRVIIVLLLVFFNFTVYSDDGMTEEERQRILNSQNTIEKIMMVSLM